MTAEQALPAGDYEVEAIVADDDDTFDLIGVSIAAGGLTVVSTESDADGRQVLSVRYENPAPTASASASPTSLRTPGRVDTGAGGAGDGGHGGLVVAGLAGLLALASAAAFTPRSQRSA